METIKDININEFKCCPVCGEQIKYPSWDDMYQIANSDACSVRLFKSDCSHIVANVYRYRYQDMQRYIYDFIIGNDEEDK